MDRIATEFGFQSTAADVAEGLDLGGRRAIVTGGASGIGLETARELARAGADVTLAVRDADGGARGAADIAASTGNPDVSVARLDLEDQGSIAAFVAAWDGPLDLLIQNAGIMMPPEQHTPEGWELQFATNHLGPLSLACGLHDAMVASGDARIVVVSSSGHLFSPVVFDDLNFEFRPYDPLLAYAQSKTAAILSAVAATNRWGREGVMANALNPGAIPTRLQRHVGGRLATPVERRKTPQQGAATTVLLATSPLLKGIGGRYFEDGNEALAVTHRSPDATGVARYALNPANAERLWDVSMRLIRSAPDSWPAMHSA